MLLVSRLKGVNKDRVQLYYCSESSVGASVLPVLVNGIADVHEEVLDKYWRKKKVRDGDWGEVTMNCEFKCDLLSKAVILKSSITLVMSE